MSDLATTTVDSTFAVPLEKLAVKSAEIIGVKALQHPAALVAKRFLTAMSQGNVNEVRTRIVESKRARFDEMM